MLRQHVSTLPELFGEASDMANKPLSEIIPEEVGEWLDVKKPMLNVVEVDWRDAKRRINAAKGPKKRAPAGDADKEPDHSGSSFGGSDEED